MKFLAAQVASLLEEPETRRNLKVLAKILILVLAVIVIWSVLFHFIMWEFEGEYHSWFTGFYWTLVTMSTLGFGDITFESDVGRAYAIVVLSSGLLFVLMVLPFAFIRFFYAPWLEAQVRIAVPREVPAETRDHVILGTYDHVAADLIPRLRNLGIPYVVIERDPQTALTMRAEGLAVVVGEPEDRAIMSKLRSSQARMLVANLSDAANTNLTFTFREETAEVPVLAIVEDWDAIDILELSGANRVIPIKHELGKQLASRVPAGPAGAHVVGRLRHLVLAELPVHHTPLQGLRIHETELRRELGLNIVAVWERGRMLPAKPDMLLSESSVVVLVGTEEQFERLHEQLSPVGMSEHHPALILGGGKVGRAAARALKKRGVRVHLVERDPEAAERARPLVDQVFVGNAAQRELLTAAGLEQAPAILLTTNDDATNIFLAVYCHRLHPEARLVSRITHERNLEAIHRAGADFAVSHTVLAVRSVVASLMGRDLVMLGAGADLYQLKLPTPLIGKSLAESAIGARTGLNVIAVELPGGEVLTASPELELVAGAQLVAIGTAEQRQRFDGVFENERGAKR